MTLDVIIKTEDGETQGKFTVEPKAFKTGSKGFFGVGKVVISGVKFQAQCQLVEIGSRDTKRK
jgi:hypothetical protein